MIIDIDQITLSISETSLDLARAYATRIKSSQETLPQLKKTIQKDLKVGGLIPEADQYVWMNETMHISDLHQGFYKKILAFVLDTPNPQATLSFFNRLIIDPDIFAVTTIKEFHQPRSSQMTKITAMIKGYNNKKNAPNEGKQLITLFENYIDGQDYFFTHCFNAIDLTLEEAKLFWTRTQEMTESYLQEYKNENGIKKTFIHPPL